MKFTDFRDLKRLAKNLMILKVKKTSDIEHVKWLKIKRMQCVKGEPKIYFNYDMPENFFT